MHIYFEETKYMYFFIKNEKLLKKYHETWNKDSNSIIKRFDSEPVYNEKYLKTKIKSYERKINTNLHGHKISKEGFQCICITIILIGSVFRTNKNCYPQVFLEECKYIFKEKVMPTFTTDNLDIFSDEENSDEESSGEENYSENYSDEENFIEEYIKRCDKTFFERAILNNYWDGC